MTEQQFILILLVFRIVATIICVNRAKELHRSHTVWGIFGFIFPLIALITVYCMKQKIMFPYSKRRVN